MLYLLDTDTLSLFRRGDAGIILQLNTVDPTSVAITVFSVEELAGWYDQLRRARNVAAQVDIYRRLADTVSLLAAFPIVSPSEAELLRFEELRRQKLNVGGNDLRIAAIALERGATVVTRNGRDFGRVPGLLTQNWAIV